MIMNGRNRPKKAFKNHSLDTSRQGQMEKVVLSRGAEVDIQYQVICLAERLTLNHSGNVYTCLLLGHIETNVENGSHRIILNGLEPTTRKKFLENHDRCLGEVFVPMRVFKTEKNWKPLSSEGMVAMMESVSISDEENEEGDVASSLALFVCGVVDRQTGGSATRDWGLTRLEVIALLPDRASFAVPNISLSLQPSPLAEHLLGGMRSGEWIDARRGFVTLDAYTRKAVLLLSSDPKVYEVPLIGVWLHGVHSLSDPAVWLWSQRFLRDDSLTKACALPHEPFLTVLFPCGASLPSFFDLFVPLEASPSSLDFAILSAACPSSQIREGLSLLPLAPPTRQYILDAFALARQRFEGASADDAPAEMYPRSGASLRAACAAEGVARLLPEVPDISLLPDQSQLGLMDVGEDEAPAGGASERLLSGAEIAQPKFPATPAPARAPKTAKAKKTKKKTVKARQVQVQTSFDAPRVVSRGVSAASFPEEEEEEEEAAAVSRDTTENDDPFGEFANQPRVYRLLHRQEAEMQLLRAQLSQLQMRPPLKDAAVNTGPWLLSPAPSSASAAGSGPIGSVHSDARLSAPSAQSIPSGSTTSSCERQLGPVPADAVLDMPEFSANSDTMALGESASMWQHFCRRPQMPQMSAPQNPLEEPPTTDGGLNCQKMIENLQIILSRQGSSRQSENSEARPPESTFSNVSSSLKEEAASAIHPDDDAIDISMEINLLAQKYLDPSKRAEVRGGSQTHNGVTFYGMHPSDLTLNTRQYMEKYGLLTQGAPSPGRTGFDHPSVSELSGCPAATLIKSDKLMRLPDSLLEEGVCVGEDSYSDEDAEASDVSSDMQSNDTNFCVPPNEGSDAAETEDDFASGAASDSCVHVLAGYQRQPPLPVPSALMQSLSVVFASPKRRRRPRATPLKGKASERMPNISRPQPPPPAPRVKESIKVLDLDKIRQTPKLL